VVLLISCSVVWSFLLTRLAIKPRVRRNKSLTNRLQPTHRQKQRWAAEPEALAQSKR
jgi:hypothetical protein